MTIEEKALAIAVYDGWAKTSNTEAKKYAKQGEVSLPEAMLICKYKRLRTLQKVVSAMWLGVDRFSMMYVVYGRPIAESMLCPCNSDGVIVELVDKLHACVAVHKWEPSDKSLKWPMADSTKTMMQGAVDKWKKDTSNHL